MRVNELITALQQMDPDLNVVIELEACTQGEYETRTLAAHVVKEREFRGTMEVVIRNFDAENPVQALNGAFNALPPSHKN